MKGLRASKFDCSSLNTKSILVSIGSEEYREEFRETLELMKDRFKNIVSIDLEYSPTEKDLLIFTKIKGEDLPKIDLLIGGSPCQDFSGANKERLGVEGVKSGLFFEYVRLLKEFAIESKIPLAFNPMNWSKTFIESTLTAIFAGQGFILIDNEKGENIDTIVHDIPIDLLQDK